MVVGIIVYQFKINQDDEGEIEPKFEEIVSELSNFHQDDNLEDLLSNNDKFRLFYNHTTGIMTKKGRQIKNYIVGRLKEAPYKCLSYYHQETDESQYLIINLFERESEVELFEPIFYHMTERMMPVFETLITANLNDFRVVEGIENKLLNEMKFAIFQIERLSNLSKEQKAALIYSSFERMECLRILREGPISRVIFNQKMLEIKRNTNTDLLLKPFTELNLIRRDWARGEFNKKTGKLRGEGEFLFLVKDIALVRSPPIQLVEDMKHNSYVGAQYLQELYKFYQNYNPTEKINEESELLADFLLDPDIYDFLALLQTRAIPVKKIPHILSEFSEMDKVLAKLKEAKIIKILTDKANREWICLLAQITPITIFPEEILNKISDRTIMKMGSIDEFSLYSPITKEVASIALDLLVSTYNEVIEF
ncbi:hypothetical protein [Candidatus Lokiarchaeum ossiferum]|uniref:hypothetical protein n=1 Tax=Candidatus Lokiarchaeum ossiferum TaxID=2951803 RepID=UPI00352CF17C